MKLAYLVSEYPAISHTFIYREIQDLRKMGIEVFPVSVNPAAHLDQMSPEEQSEAAQTLTLKTMGIWRGLACLFQVAAQSPFGFLAMCLHALSWWVKGPKSPLKAMGYLAQAILVIPWLKQHGINHIHEHFGNPTAMVAMLIKTYGAAKYSLTIHGPDIFYQVDSSLLKEKLSRAEFVRSISDYCKSQVQRILEHDRWSSVHTVRCGVDPDLYGGQTSRPKAKTAFTILCVGRLVPAKGQHVLIESLAEVRDKGHDVRLRVVGTGPDQQSLMALVQRLGLEESVTFLGVKGQKEVKQEYEQADLFVLSSFAEGVPIVLMEAMSYRIPVISTRITGIPELIEHGEAGLLVPPANASELAKAIIQLAENIDLRTEFGRKGRETIQRHYNLGQNNSELKQLFCRYGMAT